MKIEDLNLSALKYFLDAVENKSITLSAAKNHVSRPAVSQAILRLEQWYGKYLLEHKKREFELTEVGRDFYFKAKRSFSNLKEGFSQAADATEILRIGCSASLIDFVFPIVGAQIKKAKSPTIKVGPTHRLMELLANGEITTAFTVDSGGSSGAGSALKVFSLHSGVFQLLSRRGKYEKILITTEPRVETDQFQKYVISKKISFDSHIRVESWSVAARLAQLGVGCCLVPDFINLAGLKNIPLRNWKVKYEVKAVIGSSHPLSSLEKKLMETLSQTRDKNRRFAVL